MKKATLFIAALALLPGFVSGAGMPAMPALPQPVISDLTNYPNPFDSRMAGPTGATTISYELAADAQVKVTIYTLLGSRVRDWDFAAGGNGGRAGANLFTWDGTNGAGQKVSKGGYIAEIVMDTSAGSVTAIRKIGVIH